MSGSLTGIATSPQQINQTYQTQNDPARAIRQAESQPRGENVQIRSAPAAGSQGSEKSSEDRFSKRLSESDFAQTSVNGSNQRRGSVVNLLV